MFYFCACFSFKEETAYSAVTIADRYLNALGAEKYPDLICLATASTVLAAKIKMHTRPSLKMMLKLFNKEQREMCNLAEVIKLE